MHISETAGRIFSIRSPMELSKVAVVQRHGNLSVCHTWACLCAKNWSNQAPLREVQTLCNTYLYKRLMDIHSSKFYGIVKVLIAQQHELVTLTLYFKGQMLKKPYHRNRTADWHGMKGMWINRKWDTLCDFVTINGLYILRSIDRGVLPFSEYLVVWAAILITLHAVRPGGYFW